MRTTHWIALAAGGAFVLFFLATSTPTNSVTPRGGQAGRGDPTLVSDPLNLPAAVAPSEPVMAEDSARPTTEATITGYLIAESRDTKRGYLSVFEADAHRRTLARVEVPVFEAFRVGVPVAGPTRIAVRATSHREALCSNLVTVSQPVVPGATTDVGNLRLESGGWVRGVVVDDTGAARPQGTVLVVERADPERFQKTGDWALMRFVEQRLVADANGVFLAPVREGPIQARALGRQWAPGPERRGRVRLGQVLDIGRVALPSAVQPITVRLIGRDRVPLGEARVRLADRALAAPAPSMVPAGNFHLEAGTDGEIELRIPRSELPLACIAWCRGHRVRDFTLEAGASVVEVPLEPVHSFVIDLEGDEQFEASAEGTRVEVAFEYRELEGAEIEGPGDTPARRLESAPPAEEIDSRLGPGGRITGYARRAGPYVIKLRLPGMEFLEIPIDLQAPVSEPVKVSVPVQGGRVVELTGFPQLPDGTVAPIRHFRPLFVLRDGSAVRSTIPFVRHESPMKVWLPDACNSIELSTGPPGCQLLTASFPAPRGSAFALDGVALQFEQEHQEVRLRPTISGRPDDTLQSVSFTIGAFTGHGHMNVQGCPLVDGRVTLRLLPGKFRIRADGCHSAGAWVPFEVVAGRTDEIEFDLSAE